MLAISMFGVTSEGYADQKVQRELPSAYGAQKFIEEKNNLITVNGALVGSDLNYTIEDIDVSEDNGAIPLAAKLLFDQPFQKIKTSSMIGDGPHGSSGTGKGDVDYYEVDLATIQELLSDQISGNIKMHNARGLWPLALPPYYNFAALMTISTRRFFARPSGLSWPSVVVLGAAGWVSPNPTIW